MDLKFLINDISKLLCVAVRPSDIKFVEYDQQVVNRSDGIKSLQLQHYSQHEVNVLHCLH